jgi:exodeoxyribonuclease VII large subunit
LKNPLENVELRRVQVDRLAASLDTAAARKTERAREQLSAVSGRLNALSPLAVLSRGYAAVFGEQGKAVSKADEIRKNEKITVRMSDGALHCTVNEKKAGVGYEQKNDV